MAVSPKPEPPRQRRRLVLRATTRRDVEAGLPVSLEIAAALRTELAGLYVTDDALLAASGLPFPALTSFAGGPLTLDPQQFEAFVRREAESCRQLVAQAAERAQLAWSFQALRGATAPLVQQACSVEDIVVIGLDRLGLPVADMIGSARRLAPNRGGVMLIPHKPVPREGPLVTVGLSGSIADALAPFAATLAKALGARVAHANLAMADSVAMLSSARLLLAPLEDPLLDDPDTVRRIAARLRAPLLLLRAGAAG